MPRLKDCNARQYSDQMICHTCGLVWDINDYEPPECFSQQTTADLRRSLQPMVVSSTENKDRTMTAPAESNNDATDDTINYLLSELAESRAREGLLRDTLQINHEWHRENGTYPADGCDDISGLLEINRAGINLPQDHTALRVVLANRGDAVEQVRQFNTLAGNTDNIFNVRQAALYMGLQCEELAEKFATLGFIHLADALDREGICFKVGKYDKYFESADRVKLLDDDIDQLVVTIGSLLSQGANIQGAFNEVHRANMAKLWPDGTLHRNEHGKIIKPDGWTGPDLTRFARLDDGCWQEIEFLTDARLADKVD